MDLWRGTGLHVVEVGGGISASFATKLLAEAGADVIKIEPVEGDPTRMAGPFAGGVPHPENSGLFLYLNAGKRSVIADVESTSGASLLSCLLAAADILVEDLGPGRLDALALQSTALHPRLVTSSISGFGQDGPKMRHASSELSAYAAGGLMYLTGDGDRPPVLLPRRSQPPARPRARAHGDGQRRRPPPRAGRSHSGTRAGRHRPAAVWAVTGSSTKGNPRGALYPNAPNLPEPDFMTE